MPVAHQDWPILGPEQLPARDCLERIKNTVKGIMLYVIQNLGS